MPCVCASVPPRLGLLAPRHVGPLPPLRRLLAAGRGSAAAHVSCRQKEWKARRRRKKKKKKNTLGMIPELQPIAWESVFEYLFLSLPLPAICQFGRVGDKAVKVRVRRWPQRRRLPQAAPGSGPQRRPRVSRWWQRRRRQWRRPRGCCKRREEMWCACLKYEPDAIQVNTNANLQTTKVRELGIHRAYCNATLHRDQNYGIAAGNC